jgi:hypothetical protein
MLCMATRQSVMKWVKIIFTMSITIFFCMLWLQSQEDNYFLGLIYRFIAYIMILVIIIFTSITLHFFGPNRYIYDIDDWKKEENQYHPNYDKKKYNIVFDSHFHTLYSDGRMTIEEGINWHIAMGFNAFAVTDHNVVNNRDEILELQKKYTDKCIIIPGIEINGFNGHFNVIGYKEWDAKKYENYETIDQIKECVEEAHKQGAVCTWNHYPWSYGGAKPRYNNMPSRKEVLSWGFDYIEASNWDDDINCIDHESYEFCNNHEGISPIAGTDVHIPDKDRLWGWTLLNINEFTPEALMEELRKGNTEVLFKEGGVAYPTKHQVNPKSRQYKPLMDIGEMFVNSIHKGGDIDNLDWKAIRTWFYYFIAGFALFELLMWIF